MTKQELISEILTTIESSNFREILEIGLDDLDRLDLLPEFEAVQS